MSSSLPTLVRSDGTPKSFWERPEGVTGLVTVGATVLGLFIVGKVFGPIILGTLDNLIAMVGKGIVLGGLAVSAFVLWSIVTSPQVHTLVSSVFKLTMRKLTGWVVEIDPIGIMRIYVDDLNKRMVEIDRRLGNLTGAISKISRIIKDNTTKYDEAMRMASAAHDAGKAAFFTLNARKAGRAEKSNVRYEDVLKKMQYLKTMLQKYREASEVMIADITDEVDTQEKEREAMLAAYGAMTAVRDILSGAGDKRALFDQAMEYSVNDYCAKIGEIDQFMSTSESFLEGLDLENGSFDEAAMAKIQEWENKGSSLLLGGVSQQTLQTLGVKPIDLSASAGESSYVKLVSK